MIARTRAARQPHPTIDPERGAERRRSWYFEKRLSLDTLVAICGLAIVIGGPFLIWGRAMESRVLTIEVRDDARAKMLEDITAKLTKLGEQMTQTQIQIGVLSGKIGPEARHQ